MRANRQETKSEAGPQKVFGVIRVRCANTFWGKEPRLRKRSRSNKDRESGLNDESTMAAATQSLKVHQIVQSIWMHEQKSAIFSRFLLLKSDYLSSEMKRCKSPFPRGTYRGPRKCLHFWGKGAAETQTKWSKRIQSYNA